MSWCVIMFYFYIFRAPSCEKYYIYINHAHPSFHLFPHSLSHSSFVNISIFKHQKYTDPKRVINYFVIVRQYQTL